MVLNGFRGLYTNLDNTEATVEKIRSHVGMIIHSTTLDTMQKVINIYGGTTWVKIEGRMLLGQSSSYAVNSTGGSATNTLSTANLPSHTHSVGAHSHGLNNHTHSVPAHAHGLNNHTHSIPALSGSTNKTGMHVHAIHGGYIGEVGRLYYAPNVSGGGQSTKSGYLNVDGGYDLYAIESGDHYHTVTTNASTTGGNSGNTANSSALTSGAASGSTANSSAFNSGTTGSGTAVNNMPPYKTVYIWERTA